MVLGDLRDKYARMRTLRAHHSRARSDPGWAEPDPRLEMTRLAADFPGALREIDRLPASTIDERIRQLDVALAGGATLPWMTAQLVFHREARVVLAAKRWLAGRKDLHPAERAAFAAAHPDLDWTAVARPPGGRLMAVIYARAALRLGLDTATLRALVLPA